LHQHCADKNIFCCTTGISAAAAHREFKVKVPVIFDIDHTILCTTKIADLLKNHKLKREHINDQDITEVLPLIDAFMAHREECLKAYKEGRPFPKVTPKAEVSGK
jgi:hypothetical protein